MSIFKTKSDVAQSLGRMTGMDFESSYLSISQFGKPSAFDSVGNFSTNGFVDLSRSLGASDNSIIGELGRLSGGDYESSLIDFNLSKFPLK